MSQSYTVPTTAPTSSPSADQPKIASNDDALRTCFSGSTEPPSPVSGQLWYRDDIGVLYVRNIANTSWSFVSNSEYSTVNVSAGSSFNLTEAHNGMTLFLGGATTINIPAHVNLSPTFRANFYIYDDVNKSFGVAGGEQFYRNGTLITTLNTGASAKNSMLTLDRFYTGTWFIGGQLGNLDNDMSNITQAGQKAMIDLIYPINSVYMTSGTNAPPFQGTLGVSWVLYPEGYAIVTANDANVNTSSGVNRIDTGATGGHALVPSEVPNLSVTGTATVDLTTETCGNLHVIETPASDRTAISKSVFSGPGFIGAISTGTISGSTTGGGGIPHYHFTNVYNYKVKVWKRES